MRWGGALIRSTAGLRMSQQELRQRLSNVAYTLAF